MTACVRARMCYTCCYIFMSVFIFYTVCRLCSCSVGSYILPFYGNQGYILGYASPKNPLAFDISLYFRSSQTSGLIFSLSDTENNGKVTLLLDEGQLELHLEVGGKHREFKYFIAPDWVIQTQEWYFVHVSSDRRTLKLQLDGDVITTEAVVNEGLFSSSKFTVAHTGEADDMKVFRGCMKNIHTGIQLVTDMSAFQLKECLSLPSTESPHVFSGDLPLDGMYMCVL